MQRKLLGFTIVELLIVIVVIGILAAISVVAYAGIQDAARAATAQSDLNGVIKKIELYRTANETPFSDSALTAVGIAVSKPVYDTVGNNLYFCSNRVTKEYAIGARTKDNKSYFIAVPSGVQKVAIAPMRKKHVKPLD